MHDGLATVFVPAHEPHLSSLPLYLHEIYFAEPDILDYFCGKYTVMIQVNKKICPHDHICPLIKVCPVGAITQDLEGFPVIDGNLCLECGACVEKCPMKAMEQIEG